jgi:pimeloyl-ACP methyl ester carboxylesterase
VPHAPEQFEHAGFDRYILPIRVHDPGRAWIIICARRSREDTIMKRGYADTPEGQMHYYEEGSGEPLLLLHATGSSRSLMKLLPLLSGEYRAIAIDSLGEGNSDPLSPGAQIHDLARSYVHFMDAMELEKAHVFGLHTGNKVGTELGAEWPARVDGLILCGQTHSIQVEHKNLVSVMGARDRPMTREFDAAPDGSHLVQEWATQFNYMSALWWGTYFDSLQGFTPEVLQHRKERVLDVLQLRGMKEKYRAIFAYDLGKRMREIKVKKTLVVELRVPEEKHLPPQGPYIVERISGSRLVTIEHNGPGRSFETQAAQLATAILDYLREVRSARA